MQTIVPPPVNVAVRPPVPPMSVPPMSVPPMTVPPIGKALKTTKNFVNLPIAY